MQYHTETQSAACVQPHEPQGAVHCTFKRSAEMRLKLHKLHSQSSFNIAGRLVHEYALAQNKFRFDISCTVSPKVSHFTTTIFSINLICN
jgi:hypothetical protein